MTERNIIYRMANESDIPGMTRLPTEQWGEGTEDFWKERISGYIRGDVNPQHSLATRIIYVATQNEETIGFIAGHLTKRFGWNNLSCLP